MCDMTEDKNTGMGQLKPLDADESMEITIKVSCGIISSAAFECTDDEYLTACAGAVCDVITGRPAEDVFQMNANAVYYNIETDLPRSKLYCASMAVTAAKRAAADWCAKNGIEVPHTDGCSCY